MQVLPPDTSGGIHSLLPGTSVCPKASGLLQESLAAYSNFLMHGTLTR